MKKIQKIMVIFFIASLMLSISVSASNNTSEIPENTIKSAAVTYQIGSYTITQDEAIGYFVLAIVVILIIAMAMKPTKK